MTEAEWDRVWCYFRNAVHSVYREIRHIGTPGDPHSRCSVPESCATQAASCRKNRALLKSSVPFRSARKQSTQEHIRPYLELTNLTLDQLSHLFRNASWQPCYGGEKWAIITDTVIELKASIDAADLPSAIAVCGHLKRLSHNSGPLVPSMQEWKGSKWQKEKWPEPCEDDPSAAQHL